MAAQSLPDLSESLRETMFALLPPAERAYRYWERARASKYPGWREVYLKRAEGIFDELRMFQQRLGVLEELAALYDGQGRDTEAAEAREKIRREVEG